MIEKTKTVGVYTHNDYLFQKIKLSLPKNARAVRLSAEDSAAYELILVDGEDERFSRVSGLKMKKEGGDIPLPFSIDTISSLLTGEAAPRLTLTENEKTATVGSKSVKLTELEYRLLSLLLSANGAFVSRERILTEVWEEKADKGIINVYVHYLREKLETEGEKIILSSRNYGYKISEKYLGGEALC